MKTITVTIDEETWRNFEENARKYINMTPEQYATLLIITRSTCPDFLDNFQDERKLPDWAIECFIGVKDKKDSKKFFEEVKRNRALYGVEEEEKKRLEMF